MEQQPPPLRTPSPSASHCESPSARSTPALDSAATPRPTSQDPLSNSEPSLRFPRPQGSRHLANWITSSNPDIMRLTTTTEDTGLSESTYEFVSGTDTESQDGNYNESMSESIGSLDVHRPDDVHSLAGTEHTYDDESIIDEPEVYIHSAPDSQDEVPGDATVGQPDGLRRPEDTDAEPESEDEARSRSSLEYTQQSLKTPSIQTPEASKIVERPTESAETPEPADHGADGFRARLNKGLANFWTFEGRVKECVVDAVASALPGLILAAMIALLIPVFYSPPQKEAPHLPADGSIITSVSTPPFALSSTKTASTQRALSTATGGGSLVPLENVLSNDWLFVGKKPELSVSKHDGSFLVHIPADIKDKWLARHCLDLSAKRDDDRVVRMMASSVDEGMMLTFPKEEFHGTIIVDIAATCRPRVKKILRITFGKGIMGEVIDRTKHFANDLTELVPAAAQEAERRLEGAKRSLESASDNLLMASDGLFQGFGARFNKFHRSLGSIKTGIRDNIQTAKEAMKPASRSAKHIIQQIQERLPNAQGVQNQAQLGLLDAQISAKIWWLKMTGQNEEHDRYSTKAKEFLRQKLAEVRGDRHTQEKADARYRIWPKVFGGRRCANSPSRGMRGTQQCNHAV